MDQEEQTTREEFSELSRNLWLALIFGLSESDKTDSENN